MENRGGKEVKIENCELKIRNKVGLWSETRSSKCIVCFLCKTRKEN